ncbi:MAG: outer membrane beta-barrel protein [Flavobacteriaceae bacterium]|nr:outer membrane beta-barrel protein [Flavobacteriaceae bacterium]
MQKIVLFFFLFSSFIYAQNDSTFVDHKYLEDQLYINVTYIKLLELPDQISQTGFSYGVGLGFIKDLPINKKRNFGLGVGLGYGANVYYFNVEEADASPKENNSTVLKSNKFVMHTIEMPIELRYRTSTAQKYKFWRLYPGFKMAYVFATNSSLKQREDFDVEDVIEINEFNYGVTLSSGFNKWNFHIYYGLNEIFSHSKGNSYPINIHDLRLGLIFYIL